jgi:hypothetical protein
MVPQLSQGRFVTRSAILVLLVSFCVGAKSGAASDAAKNGLSDRDRAVLFAIQHEVDATDFKKDKDFCVGFGYGLTLNEKSIISKLKLTGLRAHPLSWCNAGPKGLSFAVVAPIKETNPGTYEFVVELADFSPIQHGAHFGTLLRRGTYTVHSVEGSDPTLVSYQKSCC